MVDKIPGDPDPGCLSSNALNAQDAPSSMTDSLHFCSLYWEQKLGLSVGPHESDWETLAISSAPGLPHCFTQRTDLGGVGVVEHTKDDTRHRIDGALRMRRGREGGQVVLQRLTQDAVEGDVRPQDVAFLPAVLLQFLDLSP